MIAINMSSLNDVWNERNQGISLFSSTDFEKYQNDFFPLFLLLNALEDISFAYIVQSTPM